MVNLVKNPVSSWLARLRRGNRVWLPKEGCEATVEWPYEPPDPGYKCGMIGIRRGYLDSWFVDSNGKGIDGNPIMQPIEGELPENPTPLPDNETRHLQRAVEYLTLRVEDLERTLAVALIQNS